MSINYESVSGRVSPIMDEHPKVPPVTNYNVSMDDFSYSNHASHISATATPPNMPGRIQRSWTRTQTLRGRFSRLWIWELAASIFSLICIAIVVIVLLYENGKRLDHWTLRIPPNAVISFITTLAKTSCVLVLAEIIGQLRWLHLASAPRALSDLQIFDDASRGPFGALKLIFSKGHTALIASCASVLIVASLVIDPFAQLVLTFPSRETTSPQQLATMQVALNYDAGTTPTASHSYPYPVPQNAPFALQGAIISTAFGTEPAFDISCPTSNCTFPPLTTLGVCSTCEDVTAISQTTCGQGPFGGATTCNITVPYKLIPGVNFTWTMMSDTSGLSSNAWNSSIRSVTPDVVNIDLPYGQPAIFSAFTTYKLNRELFKGLNRPTAPSQVNQCLFAYCTKTYQNLSVKSGQTLVGDVSESLVQFSSKQWFLANGTSGPAAFMTLQATAADGQPTGPNFTMNYYDYLNIGQYMEDVFNNSVYLQGSSSYVPGDGGKLAPNLGLAMYNADNLTDVVSKVADSMTNSMRTAQANVTAVQGTAIAYATYIHIEWKWLALPIIISAVTPVLLIIVIARSRWHGIEAWKSSSMPLIFYRLDGWDQPTGEFRDTDDMFWRSRNMKGLLSLKSDNRVFARFSGPGNPPGVIS